MTEIRVYFDNMIMSGRVTRDLRPLEEMVAVDELEKLHAEGRIKRVSSKWSGIEQARTRNPEVKSALTARSTEVSVVQPDHVLLRFNTVDMGHRGFISSPVLSDIVDENVFKRLLSAGLEETDAKHLMCAIVGKCDVFVTLDTKDILPHRKAVEAACPEIRILKPSELVAEIAASSSGSGSRA